MIMKVIIITLLEQNWETRILLFFDIHIVNIISSVSAQKLMCPSLAWGLQRSARLEPDNIQHKLISFKEILFSHISPLGLLFVRFRQQLNYFQNQINQNIKFAIFLNTKSCVCICRDCCTKFATHK